MSQEEEMSQPEPGGNTETPGKKPSNYQAYRWVFTLASDGMSQLSQLFHILQENCKKFQFQLERGEGISCVGDALINGAKPEGYVHWQGVFSLKVKHRMCEVKNLLGYNKMHLEPCQNWYSSLNYTSKEETRIAGPWNEKTVLVKTITELRPWQIELEKECLTEPDDRSIHWFYDRNGNNGKTVFAKYMAVRHGATVLSSGKTADLAYICDSPRIVIFNLARSVEDRFNYQALESIKDGMILSAKYESKMKLFNPPHVIVLANWLPDMEALSRDRWRITHM